MHRKSQTEKGERERERKTKEKKRAQARVRANALSLSLKCDRTLCQGHQNCSQVMHCYIHFEAKRITGNFLYCVTSFNCQTYTLQFKRWKHLPNKSQTVQQKTTHTHTHGRTRLLNSFTRARHRMECLWMKNEWTNKQSNEMGKCVLCAVYVCATNNIIIIDNIRCKKKNATLTEDDNENEKLTSPNWRGGEYERSAKTHTYAQLLSARHASIIAPYFTS